MTSLRSETKETVDAKDSKSETKQANSDSKLLTQEQFSQLCKDVKDNKIEELDLTGMRIQEKDVTRSKLYIEYKCLCGEYGYKDEIFSVIALPNEQFASAGCDGVRIWNAQNGQLIKKLPTGIYKKPPEKDLIYGPMMQEKALIAPVSMLVCLTEERLAGIWERDFYLNLSGTYYKGMTIWDIRSGSIVAIFALAEVSYTALAIAVVALPNGEMATSWTEVGYRYSSSGIGRKILIFKHCSNTKESCFIEDGSLLKSKTIIDRDSKDDGFIRKLGSLVDGRIVSLDQYYKIEVWDHTKWFNKRQQVLSGRNYNFTILPDNKLLVLNSDSGLKIRFYNTQNWSFQEVKLDNEIRVETIFSVLPSGPLVCENAFVNYQNGQVIKKVKGLYYDSGNHFDTPESINESKFFSILSDGRVVITDGKIIGFYDPKSQERAIDVYDLYDVFSAMFNNISLRSLKLQGNLKFAFNPKIEIWDGKSEATYSSHYSERRSFLPSLQTWLPRSNLRLLDIEKTDITLEEAKLLPRQSKAGPIEIIHTQLQTFLAQEEKAKKEQEAKKKEEKEKQEKAKQEKEAREKEEKERQEKALREKVIQQEMQSMQESERKIPASVASITPAITLTILPASSLIPEPLTPVSTQTSAAPINLDLKAASTKTEVKISQTELDELLAQFRKQQTIVEYVQNEQKDSKFDLRRLEEKQKELAELKEQIPKVSGTALRLLQTHEQTLQEIVDVQLELKTKEQQLQKIHGSSVLDDYYHMFMILLTDTIAACKTIHAKIGPAQTANSNMNCGDTVMSCIDALGKHIPGISLITGVLTAGQQFLSNRSKMQQINIIVQFFPTSSEGDAIAEALARNLTLAQEQDFLKMPAKQLGIMQKVMASVESLKCWALANDVDNDLRRLAQSHCEKFIAKILARELKFPLQLNDIPEIAAIILGTLHQNAQTPTATSNVSVPSLTRAVLFSPSPQSSAFATSATFFATCSSSSASTAVTPASNKPVSNEDLLINLQQEQRTLKELYLANAQRLEKAEQDARSALKDAKDAKAATGVTVTGKDSAQLYAAATGTANKGTLTETETLISENAALKARLQDLEQRMALLLEDMQRNNTDISRLQSDINRKH